MTRTVAISQVDMPDASIEQQVFDEANEDYHVRVGQAASEHELIELARDADGLIVQYAEVSENVLRNLPELKIVSRYGIGVDSIDIRSASKHQVAVTHVPSYCEEEVATHTLSLLLGVNRHIAGFDAQVKDGVWDWKHGRPIPSLNGLNVGFVAFGKIPRTFMQLAAGFEFQYQTFDPYLSPEDVADLPIKLVSWEKLLGSSDIISIHAPLTDQTRGMLDQKAFEQMQPHAVVINTARGAIINEEALYWALSNGEIAGAGIDVMVEEPPVDSPLLEHDAIVITPHVAWYSEASVDSLRRKTAENLVRYFAGDRPHGFVNQGEIN